MADLSTGIYATYDNAGAGIVRVRANYAAEVGQGIAGKTIIVSAVGTSGNDLLQSELDALVRGISYGETNGSPAQTDAFTVVGISGTVDNGSAMYLALQGTGTVQTNAGDYASNVTVTVVSTFDGISG